MTSPLAGEYTVGTDGVKVNGFWYFHEEFGLSLWKGKKVCVREDPVDVSRVFVLLNGTWLPAISERRRAMRDKSLIKKSAESDGIINARKASVARKRQEAKPGADAVIPESKSERERMIERRKAKRAARRVTDLDDAA